MEREQIEYLLDKFPKIKKFIVKYSTMPNFDIEYNILHINDHLEFSKKVFGNIEFNAQNVTNFIQHYHWSITHLRNLFYILIKKKSKLENVIIITELTKLQKNKNLLCWCKLIAYNVKNYKIYDNI